MRLGALCAPVLAGLMLLTLYTTAVQGAVNTDAYFVREDFSEHAVKGEESATYDYLEIRVVLNANVSGPYNLTAGLEFSGREISSIANSSLFSAGRHDLVLRFKNRDIYNGRVMGNCILRLSLRTPNFQLDPVVVTYQTAYYHFADFNPDFYAQYPPGSEFQYTSDAQNVTISNNYLTFVYDKKAVSMSYYFTQDKKWGKNGRFTVTSQKVLGYQDKGDSFFERADITHEAVLGNGTWSIGLLENGTHRAFGPYMRFNISYLTDIRDLRLGTVASTLTVNFSFYFTGNPHPSSDRQFTITGATQCELVVSMELSRTIGGTGLVLEQTVGDTSRNSDYLLRDAIGDFKYTLKDVKTKESPLKPRSPDSIAKISFLNRYDNFAYGVYSWATPAESRYEGSSAPISVDATYIPEGRNLRLYTAYHTRSSFTGVRGVSYFGLEGTTPPPPPPGPPAMEKHDPLLYLLGSFLALAIIFLSMRIRSRSYIEETDELDRIEEMALREEPVLESAPVSITEKVAGEEDEWRRQFEKRKTQEEKTDGKPAGKEPDAKPNSKLQELERPRRPKGKKKLPKGGR